MWSCLQRCTKTEISGKCFPLFCFKGKSTFYVLIYHSRLPKPSPFVMQWNADTHFFCLNPHLAGSPAGRCYWQLSLRKYTGWNTDPFEDSGRFATDFSRAIFHTLPFDKGSKLIEIIWFWNLHQYKAEVLNFLDKLSFTFCAIIFQLQAIRFI